MSSAPAPVSTSIPLPVGRLVGVGAIIFFANAALLVLQLVAGRLLSPYIGSSLETWTSIIGVFLAGIALGNAFGGRLADRYPTPKTLAILLGVGAVAALWMLLFPQLLASNGAYKSIPLGPRIPILAAILCLPAGFVLSLLTPLAIKLGLPDVAHTGRVAGLIFALSTLGCLVGNYVTGFYLIPTFTVNALVLFSAGALVVLAMVALVVVKPSQSAPLDETEEDEVVPPDASADLNPHAFPDIRQAYLIVFLASFCGMTLELTASRVLAQYLGVSLFTWTGIIGVMLAGTALGNFTGGQLADRAARPSAKLSPRFFLATTLIGAAAVTVLLLVTMAVVSRSEVFDGWNPISQVMGWTFSMFFLPMFALGLVSPQVIRLAVPDVSRVGEVAGRVYAWSTAGAIVGTFAAGYVLLSTLGMYRTVLGAAFVLACSSFLVVNIWKDTQSAIRADDKTVGYNAAGAGSLLYLFSIVLGGIFGGFILTSRSSRDEGFVAQVESNYYTIKVNRERPDSPRLKLTLDHLVHSSVDPYDPEYLYYRHEHIQMEFLRLARTQADKPKALVIGGGGYTFPRYAMEMMPEAQVDVVEIDPMVTQVARDYLGLKDYPGLQAIHMDGRQFVAEKAQPGSYDLVIQDAVNDLSVPAHLMTKEYNDAVKASLKPGGAYLLTIIDSVAYGKLWKAAMATLTKTFPAENVVLLTAEEPEPAGTPDGAAWDRTRRVLVIYASDKPFSVDAVRDAVVGQAPIVRRGLWAAASVAIGAAQVPPPEISGPPPLLGLARYIDLVNTIEVPAARLKPYTDREPGVILTDQFCPIDNLMAEVFRQRYK
ncbi:spermidine synthase : Putative membrane protein OS=Myxococcus xanthus (strain DK 1622) GN=MXAN_2295 PE=4 SV=1: MFS_1: Spermine_synth [Gemmata massiliana]|uniref:PABS domain-containing protein n=1 Tax=Gemmata massiliana TaxID=1210884 RepID=A0A6P2DN16_9BACT|nr:fused MFS/spermidine synthase [Gemmata massiliana]VTS02318.1 spermidine synthase : Putative membrane protein OS=Myxococcus xanthus (strain DK 1622) GN=MXAN_2295 PE=4 SV=1: MFS_1: Spermine_synth [Gemmata massiliana]